MFRLVSSSSGVPDGRQEWNTHQFLEVPEQPDGVVSCVVLYNSRFRGAARSISVRSA